MTNDEQNFFHMEVKPTLQRYLYEPLTALTLHRINAELAPIAARYGVKVEALVSADNLNRINVFPEEEVWGAMAYGGWKRLP